MAQATDQEIPAELQDLYEGTLQGLTWKDKPFIIKERHPFRIPTLQGCRYIRPPIPRGSQVSAAMCNWRKIFCECVKCFNRQPATDGAEPDGLGPYGRDWWFNDAIGKLPWYFNWFMMQTGDAYSAGEAPLWCKTICDFSAWAVWPDPVGANCNHPEFQARNGFGGIIANAWCATSIEDPEYLHVFVGQVQKGAGVEWPIIIRAYEVPDGWECAGITGNKDPRAGRLLDTLEKSDFDNVWHTFNISGAKRVVLVCDTENAGIMFRGRPWNGGLGGPAFS